MDFTLEEAFDVMYELVLSSGLIGVLLYFFAHVHTYV